MRKSKFSEHGIIAILKAVEAGRTVKNVCCELEIRGVAYLAVEVEVRQFCYLALAGVTQMGEVILRRF
jgi:hypothetical protein